VIRTPLICAALTLPLASAAIAGDPIAAVHRGATATKARDIDGFALGSSIRDAAKRFTVTYSQGDQLQGRMGDIELVFEVCPSGAIYMVETTQSLGHFTVDKKFLDALNAKLSAKYGRPVGGTPDNLMWSLSEPVRYTTGEVRPFTTNWMSAVVMDDGGDEKGVTLDLKMLDFRICWAEREKANQKPRDAATGAVRL